MKKQTTYWMGNKVEYTGVSKVLSGGLFYEVKILEGHMKGQLKHIITAPKL